MWKKIKNGKSLCPECQEKHQKALHEHKDYNDNVSFKISTNEKPKKKLNWKNQQLQ